LPRAACALRPRTQTLHGLKADARTDSGVGEGLYVAGATRLTYERLAQIADRALRQRLQTRSSTPPSCSAPSAGSFGKWRPSTAPGSAILDCNGAARRAAAAHRRARQRPAATPPRLRSPCSSHQLAAHEPLDRAERRSAIHVDTGRPIRYAALAAAL